MPSKLITELAYCPVADFEVENNVYELRLFLNDGDYVEVYKDCETTKLVFDCSGNVLYQDIQIGKLRHPIPKEGENLLLFLNDRIDPIHTNAPRNHVEAYFIAETFIVKYFCKHQLFGF